MNKEKFLTIESRKIGLDYPPFVIAEIGINHEGSLETAFQMVDSAWRAGAEAIKHQTHIVEDEMSKEAKKVIPGNSDVSIYEIMERCALNEKDETKLKEYVESKGMIFISTPFSRAAADRLERMKVSSYKIGSGECNNYPLVEHIASFGKPMIVSTGMNSLESVKKTVKILEDYKVSYALLHTTNLYPTPDNSTDVFRYSRRNRIEDITASTESIDIPDSFLPCAVSGLAFYMAQKRPQVDINRRQELKLQYEEEFKRAIDDGREKVDLKIYPKLARA